MKRLAKFLRSVLPADRTQLIFLFGIVCLYIAGHLRSWPAEGIFTPYKPLLFAAYMTLLAGAVGYFVCFWPGRNPARRILYWVCLPAVVGLSLTYGLFLYYALGPSSANGTGKYTVHTIGWALSALWKLGPGFHSALLGLILVALFGCRLATGRSSLPLALPESSVQLLENPASWRRVQILVWILVALVGPLFIFCGLILAGIAYLLIVLLPWIARLARLAHVSVLIASVIRGFGAIAGYIVASPALELGFALFTLGKEGWKDLRRAVRLPKPEYFLLALAFPFAIATFVAVVWRLFPPVQFSYQTEPLHWTLFGAFFEEIIFRGLLQPRFIRRYGLLRGIFLVGIVWAAAHFFQDFSSSHFSHGNVLLQIGWRLLGCVVLSFVLGWLTLRTRSVLPATVAHGFDNVLIVSTFGPRFLTLEFVRIFLWGALAYVLFRYWPVRLEGESGASTAEAASQPGT